ncbi:MAG: nucleotide pyrophosphohydrolase [Burkholderiales bacterium]
MNQTESAMADFTHFQLRIRQFADERDWDQYHTPKNLAMALIVEAAELVEHFQWLSDAESQSLSAGKLQQVSEELADIQIYLLRIADKLNVDMADAVDKKLAANALKYPVDKARGNSKKYNEF